jgi:hypothetical protein
MRSLFANAQTCLAARSVALTGRSDGLRVTRDAPAAAGSPLAEYCCPWGTQWPSARLSQAKDRNYRGKARNSLQGKCFCCERLNRNEAHRSAAKRSLLDKNVASIPRLGNPVLLHYVVSGQGLQLAQS